MTVLLVAGRLKAAESCGNWVSGEWQHDQVTVRMLCSGSTASVSYWDTWNGNRILS